MLRKIARTLLLLITIIVFVFALLSGSESYGGGFWGIIKNAPNALPWILLFVLNYLVWKKELTGGVVLTLFGLFITYLFNFSGPNFWWSTLIMTSSITILGVIFIYLYYEKRNN